MRSTEEFCKAVYERREKRLRIRKKRRNAVLSVCIPLFFGAVFLALSPALRTKDAAFLEGESALQNQIAEDSAGNSLSDAAAAMSLEIRWGAESKTVEDGKAVQRILSLLPDRTNGGDEKAEIPSQNVHGEKDRLTITHRASGVTTQYLLQKETKTVAVEGARLSVSSEDFDALWTLATKQFS